MTPEEQAAADKAKTDADTAAQAKADSDKVAADKVAADKVAADATEAAAKAKPPEKYDLKLAAESPLDPSDIEKIAAIARTQGLSNEQAKALLVSHEAAASGILARQQQFVTDERAKWIADTKADRDLGGTNFPQTETNVKRAMDKFAPAGSAFRKLVDETGYGNHPEFVRFVSAIGKAMAEDTPLRAGASNGEAKRKPIAEVFFGDTPQT